jgi:hypothetical protein
LISLFSHPIHPHKCPSRVMLAHPLSLYTFAITGGRQVPLLSVHLVVY